MANTNDLKRAQAIKRMRDLADRLNPCIFCTRLGSVPFASRPMITAKTDDEGTLWFFSATGSHKNTEIKVNDHVELLYGDFRNSEFLSVFGRAEIITDPALARQFWKPALEPWFNNGPDDPDLTLIKVTPILGNYWDEKLNQMKEMFKTHLAEIAGAADGYANGVEAALSS